MTLTSISSPNLASFIPCLLLASRVWSGVLSWALVVVIWLIASRRHV